ncbi:MAG TPA: Type 1 glutamine amidotransferase-like domain-containing protein [Candidatus Saccharimonadales bacterium]|nr:Type 1 glutamine amidotransferase-like domain-containing protein [Candidatus Saccharimonadales bacterium]
MRLFLSSHRAGRHDKELIKFLGNINRVAVITNAKDYKTPEGRQTRINENFDWWRSVGIEPTEVDLRPYFHKNGAEELFKKHNFIWLAGGNVFLLRRALNYSGIDKYLGDAVRKNEVILGGESAGAIIMGPTLKYSETEENEDSPFYTPRPYQKETIWEGLDLVSYVPVPHYKTAGYIGIDEYIEKLEKTKIPYKKMTDNQAIIINGDKEEFLK